MLSERRTFIVTEDHHHSRVLKNGGTPYLMLLAVIFASWIVLYSVPYACCWWFNITIKSALLLRLPSCYPVSEGSELLSKTDMSQLPAKRPPPRLPEDQHAAIILEQWSIPCSLSHPQALVTSHIVHGFGYPIVIGRQRTADVKCSLHVLEDSHDMPKYHCRVKSSSEPAWNGQRESIPLPQGFFFFRNNWYRFLSDTGDW
jgi:hypothetical protein